jgi:transcriptional regulator with PAS, ATPase and Fis domain
MVLITGESGTGKERVARAIHLDLQSKPLRALQEREIARVEACDVLGETGRSAGR